VSDSLPDRLRLLADAVDREEQRRRNSLDAALPIHRASARNLAHYIGLRRNDVRRVQLDLAALALSSLGRCEGHVRDTIDRLLNWLTGPADGERPTHTLDRARAEALLHRNTEALFGPRPPDRHVYIMVTAPDALAATEAWATSLIDAGTDVLRINAAHGTPAEWATVASTFRAVAARRGKSPRIFVDLPGPKLRTEVRGSDDPVVHVARPKDRFGRTTGPAVVTLVGQYLGGAQMAVPSAWLSQLQRGDTLQLTDASGRKRTLQVLEPEPQVALATCSHSLYLTPGLPITWRRFGRVEGKGVTGPMPRQARALKLSPGDTFTVGCDDLPDTTPNVLIFPEPPLLAQVKPGERVVLDDGRIGAVVDSTGDGWVRCSVTTAVRVPTTLRSGKGIAFPDSTLVVTTLGGDDEVALTFALAHADGVGLSFINRARDVALVGARIREAGRQGFGMILKLETRAALAHLPEILFEALKHDPVGLMIARGDLAVELSFERLAEMQEELLWFGEACHLPVIWATQVLDSLAQSGVPTRAEVTDAAMGMRAECVMLNKGPQVHEAVRMLANIIRKMEAHQFKKLSLYRPLALAKRRPESEA